MKKPILLMLLCFLTACVDGRSSLPVIFPKPQPPVETTPGQPPIKAPTKRFLGTIEFIDKNCPNNENPRFCKLKNEHTFLGSDGLRNWQTVAWADGNNESGTTNGADIPRLVRKLVGYPFDEKILPAAIVHDHYTFNENHHVNWYDTHLMYLQILLDQGLDPVKAYTQYFAVYTFGDHWTEVVKGETCSVVKCVKTDSAPAGEFHQASRLHTDEAGIATKEVFDLLTKNPSQFKNNNVITLNRIHRLAKTYDPKNPFLRKKDQDLFYNTNTLKWLEKNTTFTPKEPTQASR
jgi:hypothetical protein